MSHNTKKANMTSKLSNIEGWKMIHAALTLLSTLSDLKDIQFSCSCLKIFAAVHIHTRLRCECARCECARCECEHSVDCRLQTAAGLKRKATTHSQNDDWKSAQLGGRMEVVRPRWWRRKWTVADGRREAPPTEENDWWVTAKPASNQSEMLASVQFNEQWLTWWAGLSQHTHTYWNTHNLLFFFPF